MVELNADVFVVIGFLILLLIAIVSIFIRKTGTINEKVDAVAGEVGKLTGNPEFIKSGENLYNRADEPIKMAFETINKLVDIVSTLNIPVIDPLVDAVDDVLDEITDGIPAEEKDAAE